MTRTRARSCTGKRPLTRDEAQWLLRQLRAAGAAAGAMAAYPCKACGRYHVGHVNGRKRAAAR